MAIITTQLNPQPMEFTELSVNLCTSVATYPEVPPVLDFCYCDYDCDYKATVLAGSNDYETDRTDFLIEIPDLIGGSFEIYLQNVLTGVETVVIDNTYGTYFSLGYVPTNPDKGGYLFNWALVRDALGFGRYKVRIVQNFFGDSIETISNEFRLIPYSVEMANNTVKIETVQNGCIQGGIDYTGLNWVSSVRLNGYFYEITPRTEVENFVSTDRSVKRIQETTVLRYQLDTKLASIETIGPLKNDKLMADSILITDYNVRSFEDLRQIKVVRTDFEGFNTFRDSRKGVFSITFDEKKQDKIKRS